MRGYPGVGAWNGLGPRSGRVWFPWLSSFSGFHRIPVSLLEAANSRIAPGSYSVHFGVLKLLGGWFAPNFPYRKCGLRGWADEIYRLFEGHLFANYTFRTWDHSRHSLRFQAILLRPLSVTPHLDVVTLAWSGSWWFLNFRLSNSQDPQSSMLLREAWEAVRRKRNGEGEKVKSRLFLRFEESLQKPRPLWWILRPCRCTGPPRPFPSFHTHQQLRQLRRRPTQPTAVVFLVMPPSMARAAVAAAVAAVAMMLSQVHIPVESTRFGVSESLFLSGHKAQMFESRFHVSVSIFETFLSSILFEILWLGLFMLCWCLMFAYINICCVILASKKSPCSIYDDALTHLVATSQVPTGGRCRWCRWVCRACRWPWAGPHGDGSTWVELRKWGQSYPISTCELIRSYIIFVCFHMMWLTSFCCEDSLKEVVTRKSNWFQVVSRMQGCGSFGDFYPQEEADEDTKLSTKLMRVDKRTKRLIFVEAGGCYLAQGQHLVTCVYISNEFFLLFDGFSGISWQFLGGSGTTVTWPTNLQKNNNHTAQCCTGPVESR